MVRNFSDNAYSQGSGQRITVYFNGGLGNQLFQLAGGLAIAQNSHCDVVFSESEISRAMLNTRRQFAIGELLDVGELSEGSEKFSKKNLFGSLFHKDTNIYEKDRLEPHVPGSVPNSYYESLDLSGYPAEIRFHCYRNERSSGHKPKNLILKGSPEETAARQAAKDWLAAGK